MIAFGNEVRMPVHILVCTAFHGPPNDSMTDATVDHINRVRDDNDVNNICRVTKSNQAFNREGVKQIDAIGMRSVKMIRTFISASEAESEDTRQQHFQIVFEINVRAEENLRESTMVKSCNGFTPIKLKYFVLFLY